MNWRRNLGPALTEAGHALVATGVLPNMEGHHSHFLTACIASGFVLAAAGRFFTRLYAPPK